MFTRASLGCSPYTAVIFVATRPPALFVATTTGHVRYARSRKGAVTFPTSVGRRCCCRRWAFYHTVKCITLYACRNLAHRVYYARIDGGGTNLFGTVYSVTAASV